MFGEDLGRRSVSEAFSRLFVEVTRHRVEQALWHDREIGVAGQEAADAPVGVLDGTFLPGCAWIAEPASGTDPDFQSSEAGKLRAAVEGEALPCEGRQRREGRDDPIHDRTGVPALVLEHDRIAALAFDERGDIGRAEVALEDQEITLPMAELGAIANEFRTLRDPALGRKGAVPWPPGAPRPPLPACLGQVAIKAQLTIFLRVNEAVDRLGADPDKTEAVADQAAGDLLGRPTGPQAVDDQRSQPGVAPELAQTHATLLSDVIGDGAVVAVIIRDIAIPKRVATNLPVDRRAMATKLARHDVDRHLAGEHLLQAAPIGESELQVASRHAKISKCEASVFTGMSHLEIECTRLHRKIR